MKLGIRFADNDFSTGVRAFMEMFIIPTFVDKGNGHMVTYLTSAMVVNLFNTHMPYIDRFLGWYFSDRHDYRYYNKKLHECELHKSWLKITEMEVYWDDNTDAYIKDWNSNNNCEFIWTDGIQTFIT